MREQPDLQVAFYAPPFKKNFDEEDTKKMVKAVNAFKPDILFIGMTAPKQEKWAIANKDQLNVNVISSIGAVFDFYAGTVKRPSKMMIAFKLEWLGRLLKEPKRMWKRYLYFGPYFIYLILSHKLFLWKQNRFQVNYI